jgi:prefoldin subunit 5
MDTARSFNSMLEGLKDNFSAINNAYEEFEKARKELDSTPESIRALKEKVENIEKATEKFIL